MAGALAGLLRPTVAGGESSYLGGEARGDCPSWKGARRTLRARIKNDTVGVDSALERLQVRSCRLDSEREPMREWLKGLAPEDRRIIREDIKDVEFSWSIGMPLVWSLGDGLWEVRSHLTGGKIARVIFAVEHGAMVLLHGFTKKTQKIPDQDLEMARKRKKGEGK